MFETGLQHWMQVVGAWQFIHDGHSKVMKFFDGTLKVTLHYYSLQCNGVGWGSKFIDQVGGVWNVRRHAWH